MAVRFNPNVSAYLNTDPLSRVDSLDQLETSPLYAFSWNGRTETVYHTDSFDYVVPVVEDDSPVSVEIQVKKPLKDELSGKEYFGKCKLMPYGVLVFALKEVEN